MPRSFLFYEVIMSIIEIILLGIALSMDAFAVAVGKGLSVGKPKPKHYFIIGAWFGGFQALMPLAGYFLGKIFENSDYIEKLDHWIAFFLLAFLGGKMIKEAFAKNDEEEVTDSFAFFTMLLMAFATSVDALAVGITFSFDPKINIWVAISIIGCITFAFSALGLKIGSVVGDKFNKKAQIAGGVILILIGLKILLEHLGVLPF